MQYLFTFLTNSCTVKPQYKLTLVRHVVFFSWRPFYCRFAADTDLLLQCFHLLLQSSQLASEVVCPLPSLLHQVLAGLELVRQLIHGLLRALPVAHLFPVPPRHLGQLVLGQARGLLGLLELTAGKKV